MTGSRLHAVWPVLLQGQCWAVARARSRTKYQLAYGGYVDYTLRAQPYERGPTTVAPLDDLAADHAMMCTLACDPQVAR